MKVDAYLRRIGVPVGQRRLDLSYLTELQYAHMLTVPFENLDVMLERRIDLDIEKFYHKIVEQRRGGFCYELNGLFFWLLKEMGYDCAILSGSVKSADGNWPPDFDHMLLLVRLDEAYIVDVGFGNSVRSPLPLSGVEKEDISGTYRILPNPNLAQSYFLQKKKEGVWDAEYAFTTTPRQLHQFAERCEFQQNSPQSTFRKKWLCSLATETGRITLSGDELIITDGEKRTVQKIASSDERQDVLKKYFGFILSE